MGMETHTDQLTLLISALLIASVFSSSRRTSTPLSFGTKITLTPFGTTDIVPFSQSVWLPFPRGCLDTSEEGFSCAAEHSSSFFNKGVDPWRQRADNSISTSSPNVPIDENGWPVSDAVLLLINQPSFAFVDPTAFWASFGGNYSCSWTGYADLVIPPEMNATVLDQHFDNASFRTSLTLHVPQPPPEEPFGLLLGFLHTRRDAALSRPWAVA
jgi:hypothetical protein